MIIKTFTAVIHKEDNLYVAECPEIGTVSQGESIDLAVNNLAEATELYLEETATQIFERALITTFEATVNA